MVSIIIPVYNAEKYLEECLYSIKNQTYTDFECICVDNNSTDCSKQVIEIVEQKDSRFKYYFEEKKGPSCARNKGLDVARGDYILFIDADDWVNSDYIEKLYQGIRDSTSDVCCCGYTCVEKRVSYRQHDFLVKKNSNPDYFLNNLFKGTGGTVCSKIYRTQIIRDNKIRFDTRYSFCEDQYFALKIFLNSKKIISIDYYGYFYKKVNSEITSNISYYKWEQQIALIEEMKECLLNIYKDRYIKRMLKPKIQLVLFNLMYFIVLEGEQNFREFLERKDICGLLKCVRIDNKFSLRYILPLKLKNYKLTKLLYGIRIKNN